MGSDREPTLKITALDIIRGGPLMGPGIAQKKVAKEDGKAPP